MVFNENLIKSYSAETLKKEDPNTYLLFLAHALRYGALYKAKFFMWLDFDNYDIIGQEDEALDKLLKESLSVYKKASSDENPEADFLDVYFQKMFEETGLFKETDVLGLSLTLLSFISFKSKLLDEEEYLEIRDLLVPYKLMISQCKIKPEKLYSNYKEVIKGQSKVKLLSKLGKGVVCELPEDEMIKEALKEITYDKESWEKE